MHTKNTISMMVALLLILTTAVSCAAATDEKPASSEAATSSASWVRGFKTLEELSNYADIDLIAIGTIDRIANVTNYSSVPERPQYMTGFAFSVQTVLKGDLIKEVIVYQSGAADQPSSGVEDDPLFRLGENYVLFLKKIEQTKDGSQNAFSHPGPWGRYQIINNNVYSLNHTITDSKVYSAPAGLDYNGVSIDAFSAEIKSILSAQ